jgi:hypothetical protein
METMNSLMLGMLGMQPGPIIGMLMMIGVFWMLFGGMKNPLLWVILSVLLIMAGVGCFVYGVTDFIGLFAHRGPEDHPSSYEVDGAAAFVGAGAAGAVGGAVLLIIALLRQRKGSPLRREMRATP